MGRITQNRTISKTCKLCKTLYYRLFYFEIVVCVKSFSNNGRIISYSSKHTLIFEIFLIQQIQFEEAV